MKRNLILAGCLVLLAGCAKKNARPYPQFSSSGGPGGTASLIVRFTFDNRFAVGDFAHPSKKIAGNAVAFSPKDAASAPGCMGRIVDAEGDVDLGDCGGGGGSGNITQPPTGSSSPGITITYAGPTDVSGAMQLCEDLKEGHWVECEAQQPPPPMVAPTMRDVVTHSQEFGCSEDYELWLMQDESVSNVLPVCVTPAFIAELKKANGEK